MPSRLSKRGRVIIANYGVYQDQIDAIKQIAREEDKSQSEVLREAIDAYIQVKKNKI